MEKTATLNLRVNPATKKSAEDVLTSWNSYVYSC